MPGNEHDLLQRYPGHVEEGDAGPPGGMARNKLVFVPYFGSATQSVAGCNLHPSVDPDGLTDLLYPFVQMLLGETRGMATVPFQNEKEAGGCRDQDG